MDAIHRIKKYIEDQAIKTKDIIPKQVMADFRKVQELLGAAIRLHDGMVEVGEAKERYEEFSQLKELQDAVEEVLTPIERELEFYLTLKTTERTREVEKEALRVLRNVDSFSGIILSEVKKG